MADELDEPVLEHFLISLVPSQLAKLALGITIFAAVTTIAWMIWQLIDALRYG
jgi:hypothetical protein